MKATNTASSVQLFRNTASECLVHALDDPSSLREAFIEGKSEVGQAKYWSFKQWEDGMEACDENIFITFTRPYAEARFYRTGVDRALFQTP